MALGVRSKVALWVTLVLVAAGIAQLAITGYLIRRDTLWLREELMQAGLSMLRSSGDDLISQAALERKYGMLPFAIATYSSDGRLLARNRSDAEVPETLAATERTAARQNPNRPVFLEPYSLGRDNVAIMSVPEGGPVGYVGLFDRWATRKINRSVWQGVLAGFFLSTLIGVLASNAISRRIGSRLRSFEGLVDRMKEPHSTEQLPDLGEDEVGRLAKRFNRLANELQLNLSLLTSERDLRRRAFADWTHEIATPLSSVIGYLESLEMDTVAADPDKRKRYIATAHTQARALKELTDDLSTLSQLDFDGLPLSRSAVDVRRVVENEVSGLRSSIESARLELAIEASPSLMPCQMDPQRIGQVVRNVLVNAIRHSEAGGRITVRIGQSGDVHFIEIEDRGEGIAPEHLPHLGERFYRVDSSRNRSTGGRGLGLAIARGIVESHGGRLVITSTVGVQTSVRIELPSVASDGRATIAIPASS